MRITIACLMALLALNTNAVKMNSSMRAYSADHDWDTFDWDEDTEQAVQELVDEHQDELDQVATKVGLAQVTASSVEDDVKEAWDSLSDEEKAAVEQVADDLGLAQVEGKPVAKHAAKHAVKNADVPEIEKAQEEEELAQVQA